MSARGDLQMRPRFRRLCCGPAEPVADGVWLVRGGAARSMNAYLLAEPGGCGVTVFDTGERGMATGIATAARSLGGIRRIVLGHGDTDHRGAAPRLSALADVVCHPDAVPYASGRGGREYWRPELLPLDVRLLHAFTHRVVWDGGAVRVAGTVREGEAVAGFEVVDLAGHAPGQIGLWRARDGVALVSDCVYLVDMHGRRREPMVPLDAYNFDTAAARAAVRKLAALQPRLVLAGHGDPFSSPDASRVLRTAAEAGDDSGVT